MAKKLFVIVFTLFVAATLFAQYGEYQIIPISSSIANLGVDQEDRLWIVGTPQDYVLKQDPIGSNILTRSGTSLGISYRRITSQNHIWTPHFPPEGEKKLFGQFKWGYIMVMQVLNGQTNLFCQDYTVGGKEMEQLLVFGGPYYQKDRSYLMVGSLGSEQIVFSLDTSEKSRCDLRPILTLSGREIIQAWKVPEGFLLEKTVSANSLAPTTEVVLVKSGGQEVVLAGQSTGAIGTVGLAVDWQNQEAILAHRIKGGGTRAIHYPSGEEVFNSSQAEHLSVDIRADSFKKPFALFGGSERNVTANDKRIRVNTESGDVHLVASINQPILDVPSFITIGFGAVTSLGEVYFITGNPGGGPFFKWRWVEPKFDPPTVSFTVDKAAVAPGGQAILAWNVKDATEVEISGIGSVPLSGTRPVTITQTTTFRLTAKGLGGLTSDTVTVTVIEPKLTITSVVDGASFLPGPVVPVSYVTLNFENPDGYYGTWAASGGAFISKLGGVSVEIDGKPVWMIFNSGLVSIDGVVQIKGQVNFVLPSWLEGQTEAIVTVKVDEPLRGLAFSTPYKISIVERKIALFTYATRFLPDGRPDPAAIWPIVTLNGGRNVIGPEIGIYDQAIPGEAIVLWGNGGGKPVVPFDDDKVATGDVHQVAHPAVQIDGREAQVLWAGYAPGYPALLQINVLVPPETPSGIVEMIVDGVAYQLVVGPRKEEQ